MASDADPGGRHVGPGSRGPGALRDVLRSSRHMALRCDGQWQRQRNDAGGGAAMRRRARPLAARAAAVFLVRPFAWTLLRVDLVRRPPLGRAGATQPTPPVG